MQLANKSHQNKWTVNLTDDDLLLCICRIFHHSNFLINLVHREKKCCKTCKSLVALNIECQVKNHIRKKNLNQQSDYSICLPDFKLICALYLTLDPIKYYSNTFDNNLLWNAMVRRTKKKNITNLVHGNFGYFLSFIENKYSTEYTVQ